MARIYLPVATDHKIGRLEALSDGVFSIALTLLIIDVVAGSKAATGEAIADHLLSEWPTLVAYLVGFLTILVCWVNHHRVFHYVHRCDSMLFWLNGAKLALISAVPFPTAVLAANIMGEGRHTALMLYGITYFLMGSSFWAIWTYVDRKGLADPSKDPQGYVGMGNIYRFSVWWTLASLGVAYFTDYWALPMWAIMFAIFAFPAEFAQYMYTHTQMRRHRQRHALTE